MQSSAKLVKEKYCGAAGVPELVQEGEHEKGERGQGAAEAETIKRNSRACRLFGNHIFHYICVVTLRGFRSLL